MDLFSGILVRTIRPIVNTAGAQIEPGTEAMVLGVDLDSDRLTYLVETLENPEFEQEVLSCFPEDLEVV